MARATRTEVTRVVTKEKARSTPLQSEFRKMVWLPLTVGEGRLKARLGAAGLEATGGGALGCGSWPCETGSATENGAPGAPRLASRPGLRRCGLPYRGCLPVRSERAPSLRRTGPRIRGGPDAAGAGARGYGSP